MDGWMDDTAPLFFVDPKRRMGKVRRERDTCDGAGDIGLVVLSQTGLAIYSGDELFQG